MDILNTIHRTIGNISRIMHNINQVKSNVSLTQISGKDVGVLPKSANTNHYGLKGTIISTKSKTDYTNVKLDSSTGKIISGNLNHITTLPEGTNVSESNLKFESSGLPTVVSTNMYNMFLDSSGNHVTKTGIFRQVAIDLSKTAWTEIHTLHTGNIGITVTDPVSQAKLHDGYITFENEKLISLQLQHYLPSKTNNVIQAFTKIDYSKTTTLGTSLVGGSYEVNNFDTNNNLKSKVIVSLNQGLPKTFKTESYRAGSTCNILTSIGIDKFPITYDARKRIKDGIISSVVFDPSNNKVSETQTQYKNSVIASVTNNIYKDGKLFSTSTADYSKAIFNNDLRAVNSSITITTNDANGKLLSKTNIDYDWNGNTLKKVKSIFSTIKGEPDTIIMTDFSNVIFNYNHKTFSGQTNVTVTKQNKVNSFSKKLNTIDSSKQVAKPLIANQDIEKKALNLIKSELVLKAPSIKENATNIPSTVPIKKYRSDGTLLEENTTKYDSTGKIPQTMHIDCYDKDGKTITKSYDIDLTKFSYDTTKHSASGNINATAKIGGNIKDSDVVLNY